MKKLLFVLLQGICLGGHAQVVNSFPSLSIKANSRAMAMGDNGIASAEGIQQLLYNPAKTVFTQFFHSFSLSYMPWLTGISDDTKMINASYLGSADNYSWGLTLNYLRMGQVDARDENGATIGSYAAREYHLGGSLAIPISGHHAISSTLRFLGQQVSFPNVSNSFSLCGDLGYYGFARLGGGADKIEWGATFSNIGAAKLHLPATAGVGFGYVSQGEQNRFSVSLDVLRLINDDWRNLRYTAGFEYGYLEQFFLRAGVSFENSSAGNRKFFSLGAGYRGFVGDQAWNIDLHYLLPFGYYSGVSPYQKCWGLTLGIQIGNFQ